MLLLLLLIITLLKGVHTCISVLCMNSCILYSTRSPKQETFIYLCQGVYTDQLILRMIWCKFRISFEFLRNQSDSQTFGPKNCIIALVMTFSFLFYILYNFECAQWWHGALPSIFAGKGAVIQAYLKINWLVKTPWHRLRMRVTCSGLWAPESTSSKPSSSLSSSSCDVVESFISTSSWKWHFKENEGQQENKIRAVKPVTRHINVQLEGNTRMHTYPWS